jgi:outer membrane protein assembly factor BamB
VNDLCISGNRIGIGGDLHLIGGVFRTGIAELDLTTGEATAWSPRVTKISHPEQTAAISKMLVTEDRIYVGGGFGHLNFVLRRCLGAIDRHTGETVLEFNPHISSFTGVGALELHEGTLYASGNFHVGHTGYEDTAAFDADTGDLRGRFRLQAGQSVRDFAMAPDGSALYVSGYFGSIGDPPVNRSNLAALDPEYGTPLPWNPVVDDAVDAITIYENKLFLVGQFDHVNSIHRKCAASMKHGSNLVTSWDPSVDGSVPTFVYDIAVFGNHAYLGGRFSKIGGVYSGALAAVDPRTGALAPWDPGSVWEVHTLAVNEEYLVAGGTFSRMSRRPRPYLAVFEMH